MPQDGPVPQLARGVKVYVGQQDRTRDAAASYGLFTDNDERAVVVLASVRWPEAERNQNLTRLAACNNALAAVRNVAAVPALILAARLVVTNDASDEAWSTLINALAEVGPELKKEVAA